jgi:preprotein translocase subunit SecB
VPANDLQQITLIECPPALPFARHVLADASRNGGFPPLLLDPVDFVALYRQRLASEQGQGNQPRARLTRPVRP